MLLSMFHNIKDLCSASCELVILPLEIELGRYYRKKLDERVCRLCNRAIEDEIHSLWVYPIYANIRMRYYHKLNINKSQSILEEYCVMKTQMY